MKTKCDKCDERGYIHHEIDNSYYSGSSCECGWAIEQSMLKFKDVKIEDLLAYGRARVKEKQIYR
jgi:hypothetical protein